MIQETKRILVLSVSVALIMAGLVFASIWLVAPEVGGDWWPYIRFVFSLIPAIIIGRVVLSITAQALTARLMSRKARDVFSDGSRDSPWSEDEVEEFVGQFQDVDSEVDEE
jgi:hypothetical protein